MKYLNISKKLAAFAMAVLVLSACDKVDSPDPMGTAGQTIVKFTEGYKLINVDFVTTPQSLTLVDLRRDIPNSTELNRAMTIIVKEDPGAVTAFDPALVAPPAGLLVYDPSVPKIGTNYTFAMKPGQFAMELKATLPNASLMNLNNRYAVGFSIVSADADGKILGSQKTVIIEIGAKNAWDGLYRCTWTNYHPSSNPSYGPSNTTDVEMRTTSSNKVKIFWPLAGAYCAPAWLGGGLSYFGAQEPEYTMTGASTVTVQNAFVGATTFYTMNSSYNNRYDGAAKTYYLKWGYSYAVPGVFDAACREWTQELKYLGPR